MKNLIRTLIIVAAVSIGFGAGYLAHPPKAKYVTVTAAQPAAENTAFPLLMQVKGYVDDYYVKEKPDPQKVEYELIRAYLAQLNDPYTFFIEPAVAASESDALAGRYGGIGVDLQHDEQGNYVLYPYEDSPAARVGIHGGDIILEINGAPIDPAAGMDIVRQTLRGEIKEGAGVTLKVRNIAEEKVREYFIPFEEILEPSVIWRTLYEAPEIGYINITRFTSRTPEEFVQAVSELRAAKIQAVIVDLRNNSGGLLQESIQIASEFLDEDIISIERRINGESVISDLPGGLLLDLPLVVLVNGQTASAAEIVAGAIQAYDRGVLIGQKTYGKGSIQRIFPLTDHSSIHVTTALWFTPDEQPLDGLGLTPDITMIPDETGRDVELGEAVRYLRQQLEASKDKEQ